MSTPRVIHHPSPAELELARAAHHRRRHVCGCFVQLCRNPFYSGLVAHWELYHPEELAMLADAQADWLEMLVEPARRQSSWPYSG